MEQMKRVIEFFAAGCTVYFMMAACSSMADDMGPELTDVDSGTDVVMATGGTGPVAAAGSGSVTSPVPNANAGEAGSSAGTAACDCPVPVEPEAIVEVTAPCDVAGGSYGFAQLDLPGKTAGEILGAVRGTIVMRELQSATPTGYNTFQAQLSAMDGSVVARCGNDESDQATFYVPESWL